MRTSRPGTSRTFFYGTGGNFVTYSGPGAGGNFVTYSRTFALCLTATLKRSLSPVPIGGESSAAQETQTVRRWRLLPRRSTWQR